jgi:putative NADH-flavin reductase
MRIVVFGATGPTGQQVLTQALAAGHQVVAVARNPQAVTPRPGLTVHAADATDAAAVGPAMAGADAVLSSLGARFSRAPITLYSTATRTIIESMRAHRVRRLVVVSSGAVDQSRRPSGSFVFRRILEPLVLNRLGRTLYADMREMERLVSSSGLDWTIIRPSGLLNTSTITEYQIREDFADGMFTSRADLAASMLAQLTDARFLNKTAAVITPSAHPSIATLIWREAIARPTPKPT